MEGNTALGASSPAKPALHMPDPLSMTRAATSSSHMLKVGGLQVKTKRSGRGFLTFSRRKPDVQWEFWKPQTLYELGSNSPRALRQHAPLVTKRSRLPYMGIVRWAIWAVFRENAARRTWMCLYMARRVSHWQHKPVQCPASSCLANTPLKAKPVTGAWLKGHVWSPICAI